MKTIVLIGLDMQVNFWQNKGRGTTRCELIVGGGRSVSYGHAVCSHNDAYIPAKGREIAFGRALSGLFPDDDDASRRECWKAYFEKTNQPDRAEAVCPTNVVEYSSIEKLADVIKKLWQPSQGSGTA